MIFYLLFILIISCETYDCTECPQAESLAPYCECRFLFGNAMMFCRGIMNPDQLVGPIRATAMSAADVYSLAIENSSLTYIPKAIFKGTTFRKIRFLSSEVMSLSESDLAFEGLEDYLEEIRATDAHYIAQWDWQQLKNLKKLSLIDVNYISMGSIDSPLPKLPSLRTLGIIKAEISFIINYAFGDLTELVLLIMKGNDISELNRNMLPYPAYNLAVIDFSDNDLSNLPEDFFTKMPSLTVVKLDNNKFVTLNRNLWTWPIKHLQELHLDNNKFQCDCRLRWMAGGRVPYPFTGNCASPEFLAGTPLRSLKLHQLWC